ncbi:uncharacterized protein LOC135713909 [Ochlerotatus camptorhynchus]|uniref:uncharacterized protein LOC135713909 n=1 Tax=Ochlerotatus camptorhynchus TaxID=644619 RepID=UPI0031E35E7B
MRSLKVILLALLCIQLSHAQSYECTMDQEFCVFQGVRFFKNTTNIAFAFSGATKPVNVAFKDSHMVGIPGKFLDVFRDDLEVLKVEDCGLQSVTITRNMVALYARNNVIQKVFMDQNDECASLMELDLSSNRLTTVQNVTNCEKLKVLNLGINEQLWRKNTIDLSAFANLNLLEDLNLSDNGVFYLDGFGLQNVGLQSLKLLDLSKNDILPADLRLDILKPFIALETLKLNDNNMVQLDYADLTDFKSLKSVHLNGNNFPCRKVKDMLEFLNQHNIATPLDRDSNCGDQQIEGMCCKGPLPPRPPPPPRPSTPSPVTTTHAPSEHTTIRFDPRNPANDESDSSWQIVLAVVVIIAIVAAGAGYFIYKKRSN